jgi:hypothetical protein
VREVTSPDFTRPDFFGASGLPPYSKPRTFWQRWRRKYLGGKALATYGAVLAVAGAIIWTLYPSPARPQPRPCLGQLVPVTVSGHLDCIGLSDGTAPFSATDPFRAIELKIAEENGRVATKSRRTGAPWVAIAYLIPLTLDADSPLTREGVEQEIAGAYTAQWEAYNRSEYGDSPLVKLYLVNEGPTERQWHTAVEQIINATSAKLRVVAVAGLGDSQAETRAAAKQMSEHSLAMFGTAITADDLNSLNYPGLVRVAPTNTDEVRAAIDYLPQLPGRGTTAVLVEDTTKGDDYVSNWAHEALTLYPMHGRQFVTRPMQFNRTYGGEESLMAQQAQDICAAHPGVVFFAGRARDLERFVGAFDGTYGPNCDKPIAVISGDDDLIDADTDGTVEYSSFQGALSAGNILLYSTELQNAQEWTSCGPVPPTQRGSARRYAEFQADFANRLQGLARSAGDANAMLARDAVITAVAAIRRASAQVATSAQQPYSYSGSDPSQVYTTVTQNLSLLFNHPINGVSGVIKIDSSTGNAVGKPLTIVQHLTNGGLSCKAVEIP